ncbi:MAG: recombination mediator RecR [Cytophagales bacterium]|nr:recombination mediator RecR [Cytophagales bacterium]
MLYPSKTVENAVLQISKLPGIGKKSAFRIAMHLLKANADISHQLAQSLVDLKLKTQYCVHCHNISDDAECHICTNPKRNSTIMCVVQDSKDVMAIENTGLYHGKYYVLGGLISPVNGVGPADLHIDKFFTKFPSGTINEVILALSPTVDGDMTAFYISKKVNEYGIKITTIARGIPVGSELDYMDEITLGRSIEKRINYENI